MGRWSITIKRQIFSCLSKEKNVIGEVEISNFILLLFVFRPRLCGREFIITKVPQGRLTELTELHTVENAAIEYIYFDLFFWLYVR